MYTAYMYVYMPHVYDVLCHGTVHYKELFGIIILRSTLAPDSYITMSCIYLLKFMLTRIA